MKINNKIVRLKSLQEEYIEGEMVAYDEENKRIISFNKTASFIWSVLVRTATIECDITTREICELVTREFTIESVNEQELENDVDDILRQFENDELIFYGGE